MRIRKVSSAPIPSEEGAVVDSLSGSSTTNAPSVRAVNEGLQDIYSTNEVKTNKVWINNKPIYRKCIANGTSATNGTKFSLNSISNIDTVVNITSKAVRSTGAEIFGNYYDGSSNKFTLQYYANNNEINTWAGSETLTVTIFVEYTKTTD